MGAILDMQDFHLKKLLIIINSKKKNFTLWKKLQEIRTIPKASGKL